MLQWDINESLQLPSKMPLHYDCSVAALRHRDLVALWLHCGIRMSLHCRVPCWFIEHSAASVRQLIDVTVQ